MARVILGPNGAPIMSVRPEAPGVELRGDWVATLGANSESKAPVLLYLCKAYKDGKEHQIQIVVENPPYTTLAQVLSSLRDVESQSLTQGYSFTQSEVAKTAESVAQAAGKLALQEFAK